MPQDLGGAEKRVEVILVLLIHIEVSNLCPL